MSAAHEANAPLDGERPPVALAPLDRDDEIRHLHDRIAAMPDADPARLEALFRVAELASEKARLVSLDEAREYDRAYTAWLAARRRGDAGPQPRLDTSRSGAARAEALRADEQLLGEFPDYARADEVLFRLAANAYSIGQPRVALERYARLVRAHPSSPLVPQAYVAMGDAHLAENDLTRARAAYERARDSADPRIGAHALARLARCDLHAGDPEGALAKLDVVVRGLELLGGGEDGAQVRYDRARALEAAGEWAEAGDEYERVADVLDEGTLARDAAERAVTMFGKAAEASRGSAEAGRSAEEKWAKACDRFAALAPDDDAVPSARLQAALLRERLGPIDDALRRFAELLVRWPGRAEARRAADRILAILRARSAFAELEKRARALAADAEFVQGDAALAGRLVRAADDARLDGAIAEAAAAPGDPSAAERLRRIARDFAGGPLGGKALLEASRAWERASRLDEAIADADAVAREARWPDLEATALAQVATLRARIGDLRGAAEASERCAARIVAGERPRRADPARRTAVRDAADRLRDAFRWYDALRDDGRAVAAANRWLALVPEDAEATDVLVRLGDLHERRGEHAAAASAFDAAARSSAAPLSAARRFRARAGALLARAAAAGSLGATPRKRVEGERADLLAEFTRLPSSDREHPAVRDAAGRLALADSAAALASARSERRPERARALEDRAARELDEVVAAAGGPSWTGAVSIEVRERLATLRGAPMRLLPPLVLLEGDGPAPGATESELVLALARAPDDLRTRVQLASLHHRAGRDGVARFVLGPVRAVREEAGAVRAEALVLLGAIELRLGNTEGAQTALEEAAAADPSSWIARRDRGALALAHRDDAAAERWFAEALAIQPSSWQVRIGRALALAGLGRGAEAEAEAGLAGEQAKGDAEAEEAVRVARAWTAGSTATANATATATATASPNPPAIPPAIAAPTVPPRAATHP